ncbi:MAG TPA: leucine-rich repeat domain-containing protein [Chryseosolibacter sp.]
MIREIPRQIGRLKKLTTLRLNVNAIREIPSEIAELRELKTLDLTDNPGLSDIDHVTALTSLEELYLFGCNLARLPANIGDLKKLKRLGLTGNNIGKTEFERIQKALPACEITL